MKYRKHYEAMLAESAGAAPGYDAFERAVDAALAEDRYGFSCLLDMADEAQGETQDKAVDIVAGYLLSRLRDVKRQASVVISRTGLEAFARLWSVSRRDAGDDYSLVIERCSRPTSDQNQSESESDGRPGAHSI